MPPTVQSQLAAQFGRAGRLTAALIWLGGRWAGSSNRRDAYLWTSAAHRCLVHRGGSFMFSLRPFPQALRCRALTVQHGRRDVQQTGSQRGSTSLVSRAPASTSPSAAAPTRRAELPGVKRTTSPSSTRLGLDQRQTDSQSAKTQGRLTRALANAIQDPTRAPFRVAAGRRRQSAEAGIRERRADARCRRRRAEVDAARRCAEAPSGSPSSNVSRKIVASVAGADMPLAASATSAWAIIEARQ